MKKALIMIGGEYHPFEKCGQILSDFLEETGACEPTVTTDLNTFKKLDGYDLVILYAQREMTPQQEQGLCKFVKGGGGLVGIHCATVSSGKNKEYLKMIGSKFAGHGPITEFSVAISDKDHDVTRRVHDFKVTDEFYIQEKKRPSFEVLATGKWSFEDHPMAYCHKYGKGRVFYTALGHDQRVFSNPDFQKLIYRGIRWVAGEREGKEVRCGIVGFGGSFNMGKHHADAINNTPGMKTVAVCDVDSERLKTARKELGAVETFTDIKEMIKVGGIDLGAVVTPHNTHAELALALIKAGKHAITEKPFCVTIEEATSMIEAANAKGVMLSTFHNRRWDRDFLTIRKIIEDGLIGEAFHIEAYSGGYGHPGYWWRSHKPISGGAFYDWGAHFMDWILNLMPGKMESVYGFFHKRLWHDITNEDQCQAIIRFEGGRYAELQLSQIAAVGKSKWRILGTKGGITSGWEEAIKVTTFVNGRREEIQVPFLEGSWGSYYENVADHLLTDAPLAVTPESARRVIAVLELAEKSAKSGKPEPVPYED